MHSQKWRAGTAMGVMVGLVAGSLAMGPPSSAAEDGETGNNLSFPVLRSEANYVLPLQGTMGETSVGTLDACSEETTDATANAAIQKDASNSWQAEKRVSAGNQVTSLDWGDNIEVKDRQVGPPVRVETALYSDLADETMTGYLMCHVFGKGTDEVWGAQVESGTGNGTIGTRQSHNSLIEYESTEALVYTAGARLTIQRIDEGANPTWDAAQHR